MACILYTNWLDTTINTFAAINLKTQTVTWNVLNDAFVYAVFAVFQVTPLIGMMWPLQSQHKCSLTLCQQIISINQPSVPCHNEPGCSRTLGYIGGGPAG